MLGYPLAYVESLVPEVVDPFFGFTQVEAIERAIVDDGPMEIRRWDAAFTDRLNAAQFENITGNSVNDDLVAMLPTLMTRCANEASNNPVIKGIVGTHAIDVLGPDGPHWVCFPRDVARMKDNKQLQDEVAAYCQAANEFLSEWFKKPDLNAELSGVAILRQDIYHQWVHGNSLVQLVQDDTLSPREVQLRWNPINPERVMNEMSQFVRINENESITLGIHRNKFGKKLKYRIQLPGEFGSYKGSSRFETIPAKDMIHRYEATEAGQIVGIPLLAASLPIIADLRQFDKYTMECCKLAASFGLVFEDKFDNTKNGSGRRPGGVSSTNPTQRVGGAQMMTAPHNKEVTQIDPKHPGAAYIPFRCEQLRSIGRSVQMPLLIVRLGAEDHSFSSARFDAQIYQRGVRVWQSDILAKYSGSLMLVLKEAELLGLIPTRPIPMEVSAIFTPLPHVDPAKESKAMETDLHNMATTLIDVWAEQGKRPEDMVFKLKQELQLLNDVKPGLGDMAFVAKFGKQDPSVLAGFDLVDLQPTVVPGSKA